MANRRMISKSISTSKRVTKLLKELKAVGFQYPFVGPLLFTWLQPHVDDWGRCDGDPFWIKLNVIPSFDEISESDIETVLALMENLELINRHIINGINVLQVVNFEEHQTGLHKRTPSKFPEIPGNSKKFRLKGREGKRTELKKRLKD